MKRILFFALVIFSTALLFSQTGQRQAMTPGDSRREAIEARKISYLTKMLELTPEEAKTFWPIYYEYHRKVDELASTNRARREMIDDIAALSEEEARRLVDEDLLHFETAAALRREYTERMLEVISVKKVAILFEAERSFNRILFREAQRRHRLDGRGFREQ